MAPSAQSLSDSDVNEEEMEDEEEIEEEIEEEEEEEEEMEEEEEEEQEECVSGGGENEEEEEEEGVSCGGENEEEDGPPEDCGKGDGAKGVRSGGICPISDLSGDLLVGHSNVSTVSDMDHKESTSDKQVAPLEGEFREPLVAKKDTSTSSTDEAHHSATRNHASDGSTKSMHFDGKESELKTMDNKINSSNSDVSPNLENKVIDTQAMNEKPGALRSRSRSPSADVALETNSKRPAITCDFFARGWCIKGTSCRFLHRKDGTEDVAGLKKEIGRESTSAELLASQTAENLMSKTHVLLQRALVRRYGDEKQGEEFPRINISNQHQVRSMNEKSNSISNPLFERHAAYRDLTSGLTERKLYHEMPESNYLNDGFSSKNSLLMGNSSIPDRGFCSSGSSIGPGVHDPLFNKKSTADRSSLRQWNLSEHSTSYRLGVPLDSACATSIHQRSSLIQTFPKQANSYNHEYGPFSNMPLDKNSMTDFDRGYLSRSSSLPRSYSSPNYSQDSLVSFGHKTQLSNAWEPSMPFRSSFNHSPARISSPGSQYDPLLDSIEPLRANAQSPAGVNVGHSVSSGSHSPACNIHNIVDTVHESKNNLGHEIRGYISTESGLGIVNGVKNGGTSSEEKNWSPYAADVESVKQTQKYLKNQGDGERQNKEPKVLKIFRAALVEFVKDLLKPSWREGHLSKDAHKMIVKKAEEKVLGSLHPHQIPSTLESINQYFSSSRPKLVKLVEGYVEKYKS